MKPLVKLCEQNSVAGEIVILVANFEVRSDLHNYRVTDSIFYNLKRVTAGYKNVTVKALNRTITERESSEIVQEESKKHNAAIVIWGWYEKTQTSVAICANFGVLTQLQDLPQLYHADRGEIQTATLAELDSFKVQAQLSEEMAFLALVTLGLYCYAAKDWDGTIARLTHALQSGKTVKTALDWALVYCYRGIAYFYKQDYDKAIADCTQAIQLDPNYAYAYKNRGNAYADKQDYDKAIANYNRALQLDPNDTDAYKNRVNAYASLNYYRQLSEKGIDRLYEAKLLIVGGGGAGKTTLAKKIQDSNYQLQQNEASTEGIDVIRWHFPLQNGKEFRINIWDFGGQEIYHATHQFFLTKRSLYVLVADTRKEDIDFYYWLKVVELLSKNSPLLIVKNEKQERKLDINERQLRGEFTNLKETLATNLATNRGLPEILTNIQHYIQSLPHVGTELPKTWVKVREALEQDDRNYISLEEYLKICQDNGFTRQDDALQLSGYLHDLGVCLHFQEDDLLMRTVILKPTWGTDAVYKVLDNAQVVQNLGKFTRNDLKIIWHEDKYTAMRPELLRLMMNFKLCYQIPNCRDVYIAPQLLTPNQPEYDWDESDNLFLRYEYEFMPKGILTRFIVETHPWIENQTCVWKTGVVLSKEGARAEVIELYRYHKGEIRIRVTGKRKRDLLTTVRHELDKIHRSYERLKYKTLVPCNCSTCKNSQTPFFYNLERLYKFLDTGKLRIQCYESGDDVEVRGLIDDITESRSRSTPSMSEASKYNIKADVVQITEQNLGEVIAKKYASDPAFKETLTEILEILSNLRQNYPTATETEAEEIIEAEFEEIKTKQPHKWQTFRRQLLNRERWFNGGKAALNETAKHYADNNVFYKAGLAFLEGFSTDED